MRAVSVMRANGQSRRARPAAWCLAAGASLALGALAAAPVHAAVPAQERPGSASASSPVPCSYAGVATTSASDAWAVGTTGLCANTERPVLAHWDGTAWTEVTGAFLPSFGFLDGITRFAGGDLAVGTYGPILAHGNRPLILRLSGSRWKRMAVPRVGFGYLTGVAANSPDSAWAVGQIAGSGPVILHWNGRVWRRSLQLKRGALNGVAASSARSAWAVGYTPESRPLILHWNGRRWRRVASPILAAHSVFLWAVAAISAKNAWAIGNTGRKALALHWNGTSWEVSKMPALSRGSSLSGLDALSATSIWAVGDSGSGRPLTMHWNGSSWKVVPSNGPPGGSLDGVSIGPSGTGWAVGATQTGALTLEWNGSAWS
jgi:hypothetical protein